MEQHIDNIDFSRKSKEIYDIIRLSDFKRLQDFCLNLEDSIAFVLKGFGWLFTWHFLRCLLEPM